MNRPVLLNRPPDRWYCPNCSRREVTPPPPPGTVASRFHPCPGLRGLTAPMLADGMDAKVEARDREDYVGKDLVQTDQDGRPVMSVVTTRADGSNDTAVLAPTATLNLREC